MDGFKKRTGRTIAEIVRVTASSGRERRVVICEGRAAAPIALRASGTVLVYGVEGRVWASWIIDT
jgi:hypothetical protein